MLKSGGGHNNATFSAEIKTPGFYRIYVWWPQVTTDAGPVQVFVHHASGTTSATIDQRRFGGQWNPIGVFELHETQATVRLVDQPGAAAYVDAVRFEFVGRTRPPLDLETTKVPLGIKGDVYAASVKVFSGVPPHRWSVSAGRVPSGLSLGSDDGLISGTPREAGRFHIMLKVTDANGESVERPLTVEILESGSEKGSAAEGTFSSASGAGDDSAAASTSPDLSALQSVISVLPEGEWAKVNLNTFSNVWTPSELRPLKEAGNPTPARIIRAWSSFAWDLNRAELWLYGGGHENYSGNDVYRWRAHSRLWERASLPSEIKQDDLGNWTAVDGPDNAPSSAHTYDNNIFLPHIDRFVVFGGAAYNNGGAYLRQGTDTTSRLTGPYFFDPSKADPNKVGGTTGSHVQRTGAHPEIVGGNMWANRDIHVNIPGSPALPRSHVNGCTAYAEENGRDVVYIGARPGTGTNLDLFKYTVNALDVPSADTMEKVGIFWSGTSGKTACAFDPVRQILLRIGGSGMPFIYWDLFTAGPNNRDIPLIPVDPSNEFPMLVSSGQLNLPNCGLDHDAVRHQFALWCGDGRVWMMKPAGDDPRGGWTIIKQPAPNLARPNGDVGTGILGKWKYVPNLDVFMGLQGEAEGNIWVYKPIGWLGSGLVSTTTTLSGSPNPAPVGAAVSFTATVTGSDPGGTVRFTANGNSLGGCTAVALSGSGNTKGATCTSSALPIGTHSIGATYSGDAGNATSASAPLSQVITSTSGVASTTTLLASSSNPALLGANITFTATVTGSNPGGTVHFTANGSSLGGCTAVALSGSGNTKSATCMSSALPIGTHSIGASYSGDAGNAVSASAPLSQVITSPSGGGGNVALAIAGAVASASSVASAGHPASAVIDNERSGANWGNGGAWQDATANVFPDWVQVSFNGAKTIERVVVYTVQNNYRNPVEPTDTMTFSFFGVVDFAVQAWNGSAWVTLANVTGNNLVKRSVSFPAFTTDRIRVFVTKALNSYSRITEIEAWGADSGLATTTTLLASSSNPALLGANITFTATVTGSNPGGTVHFTANGSSLGGCTAVALSGSGNTKSATCMSSALPIGTHSIGASYSGDAGNAISASAPLSQVITSPSGGGGNVALAIAGAVASASSVASAGHPASAVIDNERSGANWGNGGAWQDATANVFPDWVQVSFNGAKTIERVVVYTLQNNYRNPVEPTDTMTFSFFGVVDFAVQAWNGSAWVTLANVTGNNLVKRSVSFPAFTTDRIRVFVTKALNSYSRITEIEAWDQ